MKKIMIIAIMGMIAFSCADKKAGSDAPKLDAKKIYKTNCVVCHGMDGKLGANGSKDLTQSKLSLDERKSIIKNGKGAMIGLGAILDAKEIQAVAEYTLKLK